MKSRGSLFVDDNMGMLTWVVCLLLVLLSASAAAADDATVLLSFKSSIEKDPNGALATWNQDSNSTGHCSWEGVSCSGRGRVTALDLSRGGVVGRLRLGLLAAIETLASVKLGGNLFYGNLTGAGEDGGFPASCGGIVELDLSSNDFGEAIPATAFASCSRLRSIDLSGNRIPGDSLLMAALSGCRSLVAVNFSGNRLAGTLDGASFSACRSLQSVDLSSNSFSGEIPYSFFSKLPPSLAQLRLSHNNFSGNFSVFDFGECGNLTVLDLSVNSLGGRQGFPASIAKCSKLENIDISKNNIAGEVPTYWRSFANLRRLGLSKNQFSGQIPPELGTKCGTLTELDLSDNKLVGGFPATFVDCASLLRLDAGHNQLSGDFLRTVVSTMPSLKYLSFPFNNITGEIPPSLANCTSLEVIDLSSNQLVGTIPPNLCTSLKSLQKLLLAGNYLSGGVPLELGSCMNLRAIDLSFNDFNSSIPEQIWTLPELTDLIMWANQISGEISGDLCVNGGRKLGTLILNNNLLTGTIPASLSQCRDLVWVSLSNNRLTGRIPPGLGQLQSLAIFQLGNNSLSGEVPTELGDCRNLIWLDLNSNSLSGQVPPELAGQAGRIVPGVVSGKQFAFVRNEGGTACRGAGGLVEFEGLRPDRLERFPSVHACPSTRIYTGTTVYSFQTNNGSMIYLDLSYNSLSGTIPPNFGSMFYLQVLNLGHNKLTGNIPDTFGGLKEVGVLDLSHNQLEGFVPGSLGTLTFLSDLDVSNNYLTGPIPSSGQLTTFLPSRYANNSGLCGVPLPPCGSASRSRSSNDSGKRRSSMAGSVVIGIAVAIIFVFALSLALLRVRSNQKAEEQREQYVESLPTSGSSSWKLSGVLEPLSINVATFEKPLRKLTFAHLLEATNGFSAESLIGSGGFGEVYKARLKDGCTVAIKKLVRVTGQGDREFTAEMETIGKIKHRNLVPLLGYCKVGDERLLVYEYMKWGSLETVLHERKAKGGASKLDWSARKKIAIGSARGLAFLHHSCIPHIIHRDMKSSNVLLDENLEARVSDFGMARLMNALDTHLSVSTLAGTPGYVPPEYFQSFRCTTKGDVYSYGVVLLELLSGKKPIDPVEFGDNNLVGWAKQLVREKRAGEIFDPELTGGNSGEAELYQYLKIASECLDDRPLRRPTMIQVMAMFKELQIDSESDILDGFSLKEIIVDEPTTEKEP